MQVIYERCAGIDIHKKTVVVCVLITQADGTLKKQIRTCKTMTADLLALDERLAGQQVEHLAMESTGVYTPHNVAKTLLEWEYPRDAQRAEESWSTP
jgi:transposase